MMSLGQESYITKSCLYFFDHQLVSYVRLETTVEVDSPKIEVGWLLFMAGDDK